jgi:hypothetical protein
MRRSIFSAAMAAFTAFAAANDTVGAQYSRLPDDPKAPLYRYGDYRLPQPSRGDDGTPGCCCLAQTNAPSQDYCAVQVPGTDAHGLVGLKGKPLIPEISISSESRSHLCD